MNLQDWRKAGKIAAEALKHGASLIKPGVKLSYVSDEVEKKIKSLDGELAFPTNISINENAAHDTPYAVDERVFTSNDVVKLDVGAAVNGAIGDTAITIDLTNKNEKLITAAIESRDAAIKLVKPGLKLKEIGKIVEKIITNAGFQPIRNLSGHNIEEYNIHGGIVIPNYDDGNDETLEEGTIIAIETFATTGQGLIKEGNNAEIFTLQQKKPLRSSAAREVLKFLEKRNGLPTSTRDVAKAIGTLKATLGLKEMNQLDMLRLYPVLTEVKKGIVAQAEHTILVTKDGAEILTSS